MKVSKVWAENTKAVVMKMVLEIEEIMGAEFTYEEKETLLYEELAKLGISEQDVAAAMMR